MDRQKPVSAPYLPSPNEIREACRKIRQEWSPRERAFRRSGGRQAWHLLAKPVRGFNIPRDWTN